MVEGRSNVFKTWLGGPGRPTPHDRLNPLTHDLQADFVETTERALVRAHEGRRHVAPIGLRGMSRCLHAYRSERRLTYSAQLDVPRSWIRLDGVKGAAMYAVVVRETGQREAIDGSGELLEANLLPRVREASGVVSASFMSDGEGGCDPERTRLRK